MSGTGEGTLVGDDGVLRAFSANDVIEADRPFAGANVEFTPTEPETGPAASDVRVMDKAPRPDDRRSVVITDIRVPWFSVFRFVAQVASAAFIVWLAVAIVVYTVTWFMRS
jgi:hypothetical protein